MGVGRAKESNGGRMGTTVIEQQWKTKSWMAVASFQKHQGKFCYKMWKFEWNNALEYSKSTFQFLKHKRISK